MARIYVQYAGLNDIGTRCSNISLNIKKISSDFSNTVQKLDWDIQYKSDIKSSAAKISRKLEEQSRTLMSYKRFIEDVSNNYRNMDDYRSGSTQNNKNEKSLFSEFWKNYGWEGLFAGSPYGSKIIELINDFKSGKSWRDYGKYSLKTYQFFHGAVKTFKDYRKIGRAVGTGTSTAWWFKHISGLKKLKGVSTAKKPVQAFINNLKNKTSPYKAQFTDIVNDFKGKNGIGSAVASWGAVASTGFLNYLDNKDEQLSSKGEMSDNRVIAETVTETAVDTVLNYGSEIVVGAAVSAVMGSAAPGILVVGTTGAVIALANTCVENATNKTVTEWISDGILNFGENIGRGISNTKVFSSWKGILSF